MQRIRARLLPDGAPFEPASEKPTTALAAGVPGTTVRFGIGQAANRWLVSGWSHPEQSQVWSEGHRAEMHIPALAERVDLLLSFRLEPFCFGPVRSQMIRLVSSGRTMAVWELSGETEATVLLAASKDSAPTVLVWDLPDAISPREVGCNADTRQLGVALHAVSIFGLPQLLAPNA
jgi:hypothetical protein